MALTTVSKIAEELNISRSYLYRLRQDGVFKLVSINGKPQWDTSIIEKVRIFLSENKKEKHKEITLLYKTIKINNRRYLGNKYKLIPFIKEVVEKNCDCISTVADIFAGTGAVASAFLDKKIITNDNMYSNYICHVAWFSAEEYDENKIAKYIIYYNSIDTDEDNYMSINFADTYFSKKDCSKIGFIREHIEKEYEIGKINNRERAILITSLLYGMDKIANTCGHYDAYRRGTEFNRTLELSVPQPGKNNNNPDNLFFNEDDNELVKHIEADLVYIDPPYNSRQYCDCYFMKNIA